VTGLGLEESDFIESSLTYLDFNGIQPEVDLLQRPYRDSD